jgi:hypothetical protein
MMRGMLVIGVVMALVGQAWGQYMSVNLTA